MLGIDLKSLIFFFFILLSGCSKQELPVSSYELNFESSVWKNQNLPIGEKEKTPSDNRCLEA